MIVSFAYFQQQGNSPTPALSKMTESNLAMMPAIFSAPLKASHWAEARLRDLEYMEDSDVTSPESMAVTLVSQLFQCCHYAYCRIDQ